MRIAWPASALLAWLASWSAFVAVRWLGGGLVPAAAAGFVIGSVLAARAATRSRQFIVAAGFPLSLLASGLAAEVPAWVWLAPLGALAILYPFKAWRDAPLFPTPPGSLRGLATAWPVGAGARILDAGCGTGDALRELAREYPAARLAGIEWSWPLAIVSSWRCRRAEVRRADMWRADWQAFDLVYLFQRPETLPRALAKAEREMRAGSCLASLEFAASGVAAEASFACADGRTLHFYRIGR